MKRSDGEYTKKHRLFLPVIFTVLAFGMLRRETFAKKIVVNGNVDNAGNTLIGDNAGDWLINAEGHLVALDDFSFFRSIITGSN